MHEEIFRPFKTNPSKLSVFRFANNLWADILRNERCSSGNGDLIQVRRDSSERYKNDYEHAGFVSSHFFFRLRHVIHPVLLRPFGDFSRADGGVLGCFLGRPRGRRATAPLVVRDDSASASSLSSSCGLSIFASMISSSSISSTFGTTSSLGGEGGLFGIYATLNVKVVPVLGDSLDDVVDCGDVLTLSRPAGLGSAGPKTTAAAM